jgi:hypothetical protein
MYGFISQSSKISKPVGELGDQNLQNLSCDPMTRLQASCWTAVKSRYG